MTYAGLGSTDCDHYIARTSHLMNRPSNENHSSPLGLFSRILADVAPIVFLPIIL
jgi:hypothetical protein